MAQKNLVHVDLKNLVLGQHVLKFEGQQNFVNLAGVALLCRQVSIARDLHGDGRRTLTFRAADVGQAGANHAQVIDATVLKKARILNRQNGVFHDLRDVLDGR